MSYTYEELTEALRAINSIIHKCKKAQEKFPEGNPHHTLLRNRLKAMYISKVLIEEQLLNTEPASAPETEELRDPELLLANLEQLHTTDLGVQRIRKNLCLDTDDVVAWCKERIKTPDSTVTRRGKNWYITVDGCEITVNAYSYTIITAHRNT